MTVSELLEAYQRRHKEALEVGATAPVAKLYRTVIEDLKGLNGTPTASRLLNTSDAAGLLGVKRKTVAKWAREGRLRGAMKTSGDGVWLIPSASVYALGSPAREPVKTPRLWRPEDG